MVLMRSPLVASYLTSIVSNIVSLTTFNIFDAEVLWHQSIAQGWSRTRLPLTPSWYLLPFLSYLTLKLFSIGAMIKNNFTSGLADIPLSDLNQKNNR